MTRRHPRTDAVRHRGAMSFMTELRYLAGSSGDRVLGLSMPATCAGCYRQGSALCRECRLALDVYSGSPGVRIGLPSDLPAGLLQLESCAPFNGIARRAIYQLTDAGERRIGAPLGQVLANRWAAVGTGGDVLVPVPTSAERVRDCGYDPAALLARVAGRRLRMPVLEVLARNRKTVIPFGFDHEPEAGDVARDFEVTDARRIRGRWAILIDDVVMTGATLTVCANKLLDAGAQAVSALVVARDRTVAGVEGGPTFD
jgi:predicted amidophosphoribosyltransferase